MLIIDRKWLRNKKEKEMIRRKKEKEGKKEIKRRK